MFEGFAVEDVDVGGVTLRVRHGGRGPAILLLHGHPRIHVTWHRSTGIRSKPGQAGPSKSRGSDSRAAIT
jgi:hypothetical protein